ncbi:DUF1348 family protein [Frankia sp. AgKG'84/4]|uniref:DUF1348 family protein n=1 Tax=Frankia sp. AgKG'84/4 TaxID=573490 RepID=UPI0020105189|nr:DUF1348 family protein [Frankia sp. AgKG'84/4]MCL9797261.1 nuclear transport factor 2 family protein [Frankia sp. AgKG'84/4]
MSARSPFPPFDERTAVEKARAAGDAWNRHDLEKLSLGVRPAAARGVALPLA